jgi:hypothetical protein
VGYGDRHGVGATRITGLFMALLWRRYVERQYFFWGFEGGGYWRRKSCSRYFPGWRRRAF